MHLDKNVLYSAYCSLLFLKTTLVVKLLTTALGQSDVAIQPAPLIADYSTADTVEASSPSGTGKLLFNYYR